MQDRKPRRRETLILALCALLLLSWQNSQGQEPTVETTLGREPLKYSFFSFPSPLPLAELLYATPGRDNQGHLVVKWGRALASGRVRLPISSEIQIVMRFDGLEHIDQLAVLNPCRVACFSASTLDFEDRHMQYLKGFKDLRSMNFGDTLITDKSLSQISTFSKLAILGLTKTNITGSGFENLLKLHHIYDLCIEGTNLKSGAVRKLRPLMANLTVFNACRIGMTKEDATIFKDLKNVRQLSIGSNRQIDDDCVKYLSHLKDLRVLSIEDTSITEKSIPLLAKLPRLWLVKVRPEEFWKTAKHQTRFGQLEIADIEKYSNAPQEVFTPLH